MKARRKPAEVEFSENEGGSVNVTADQEVWVHSLSDFLEDYNAAPGDAASLAWFAQARAEVAQGAPEEAE